MWRAAQRILLPLLDAVLGPRCALCAVSLPGGWPPVCAPCLDGLALPPPPACLTCRLAGCGASMRTCDREGHAWLRSAAATLADERALTLLRLFKYSRQTSLGEPLAQCLAGRLPMAWLREVSVIVPVPLHRGRIRERGFNQAGLLARHLADATGLPVDDGLIIRIRRTGTQTHRGGRARQAGVHNAFALRPGVQAVPRAVLLVDDVLTTGSTLVASATVLREGGAGTVLCVAFAEAV